MYCASQADTVNPGVREEERTGSEATHVVVDPACAARRAVEACDAVVGKECGEDGAPMDTARCQPGKRRSRRSRAGNAHETANAVQRVRVDGVVDLEQDLDPSRIVARDGSDEADAESRGCAEVASARSDADEAGDDARAEGDSRPLASVDAAPR